VYEKNSNAKVSKNLARYRKIILLDQNNYVESLSVDNNAAKSFNIRATSLNVLHDYFDDPNKFIFSVSSF